MAILFLSGWVLAGCGSVPEPGPAAPTRAFVEFSDDRGVEINSIDRLGFRCARDVKP